MGKTVTNVTQNAWDVFQKALRTRAFRQRRRYELWMQAKASQTLRRYGFCEGDLWTAEERACAEAVLERLSARARTHAHRCGLMRNPADPLDKDLYIWGPEETVPVSEWLAQAAHDYAGGEAARGSLAERVLGRLGDSGGPHYAAVLAAMQALVPPWLHPGADGARLGRAPQGGAQKVELGTSLYAGRWCLKPD